MRYQEEKDRGSRNETNYNGYRKGIIQQFEESHFGQRRVDKYLIKRPIYGFKKDEVQIY